MEPSWAQNHLGPSRVQGFRDGALWCMIYDSVFGRLIGPKMHEKKPKSTTINPEMEPSWAQSGPKIIWDHLESKGSEMVHYGALWCIMVYYGALWCILVVASDVVEFLA